MAEPIAYFVTWTTYGTWLPGDERGWVDRRSAGPDKPIEPSDPQREAHARSRLKHAPVVLTKEQRGIVETTMCSVCQNRGCPLHAINCRSNHVHVVVSAREVIPERVMNQFKSWCSRYLNLAISSPHAGTWWTRHGSTRYLNTEDAVAAAVDYVMNRQ